MDEEEDGDAADSNRPHQGEIHVDRCAQLLERILREGVEPSLDRSDPLAQQSVHADGSFVSFLQALVRTEEYSASGGKCLRLLEHLWTVVVRNNDDARAIAALLLIEALVSTHAKSCDELSHDDRHQEIDSNAHYYGAPRPMSWSDLVAGDAGAAASAAPPALPWIPLLVKLLPSYPSVVASILAHLYQDSSKTRSILVPHYWPRIVAALVSASESEGEGIATPYYAALSAVSKLCAVILHHDTVTPGMQFLAGGGSCGGGLTPLQLSSFLRNESTAASAAWMVEGLTRREDEAVEALCRDGALVAALGRKLRDSVAIWRPALSIIPPAAPIGLLPTLRTVGNVVIACQGRYLGGLAKALVDTLGTLLVQHGFPASAISNEVLWVMGCCLFDSGRPMHVATTTLAPVWIPLLVSVLTEGAPAPISATFEIKRQALSALSIALSVPPDVETFRERSNIQEILDAMLLQCVWHSADNNDDGAILSSLTQLLLVDDTETVVEALRLLQRLVITIPSTGPKCRSLHVLDRLHAVTGRHSRNQSIAGDLASAVLEALQEDDDESDDDAATFSLPPQGFYDGLESSLVHGSFSFGPSSPARQESAAAPSAGPVGRGRGRTLPSWMEHPQGKPYI
jgi:hypothetical protein